MALQSFNPIANQTTHADATQLLNSNFSEAESRLLGLETRNTQNVVSPVNGVATIDASNVLASKVTITENTDFVITGASAGDSGIIVIQQASPAGYSVTVSNHTVLGGLPSTFSTMTADTGKGTISWYYDGEDYLLYFSEAS